jgi:hypothetical protein
VGAPVEWIKEMGKCSDWESRQIVIAIWIFNYEQFKFDKVNFPG